MAHYPIRKYSSLDHQSFQYKYFLILWIKGWRICASEEDDILLYREDNWKYRFDNIDALHNGSRRAYVTRAKNNPAILNEPPTTMLDKIIYIEEDVYLANELEAKLKKIEQEQKRKRLLRSLQYQD